MISENLDILFRFWDAVADCLVEFHGLDDAAAYKKTKEHRRRLRELDRPDEMVMPSCIVYHEEPFYVACNLMGRQLSLEEHSEQYDKILIRHGW